MNYKGRSPTKVYHLSFITYHFLNTLCFNTFSPSSDLSKSIILIVI